METITLEYDGGNSLIKKLLSQIISAGARKVDVEKTSIEQSIEDFEKGDVVQCADFDDFMEKIRN